MVPGIISANVSHLSCVPAFISTAIPTRNTIVITMNNNGRCEEQLVQSVRPLTHTFQMETDWWCAEWSGDDDSSFVQLSYDRIFSTFFGVDAEGWRLREDEWRCEIWKPVASIPWNDSNCGTDINRKKNKEKKIVCICIKTGGCFFISSVAQILLVLLFIISIYRYIYHSSGASISAWMP